MASPAGKEGVGLPIEFGRPNRPNLVVNTPLVLKGGSAVFCGEIFENTLHTIERTVDDGYGDRISVTTAFLNLVSSSPLPLPDAESIRSVVLNGKQRVQVDLPGRGIVFLRNAR